MPTCKLLQCKTSASEKSRFGPVNFLRRSGRCAASVAVYMLRISVHNGEQRDGREGLERPLLTCVESTARPRSSRSFVNPSCVTSMRTIGDGVHWRSLIVVQRVTGCHRHAVESKPFRPRAVIALLRSILIAIAVMPEMLASHHALRIHLGRHVGTHFERWMSHAVEGS
jgi:hypothetical protein